MKKWTTLFLGFSWVVLLQSCRTYQPVFTDEEILSETIHNSYFADPDRDYVYRAGITVYGREFSGLFILKNDYFFSSYSTYHGVWEHLARYDSFSRRVSKTQRCSSFRQK